MDAVLPLYRIFGVSELVYDAKVVRKIIEQRHKLEEKLFIDRLLDTLNIDQGEHTSPS